MDTQIKTLCKHCHNPIENSKVLFSDFEFCCHGCMSVYQILNQNNLCQYYDLNEEAGIKINENLHTSKYDYLDSETIRQKLIRFSDEKATHVLFYIPQIHCSSCLWLLERLYKINSNIFHVEVLFDKKEVYIQFNEKQLSLKDLVKTLASIGYEPFIELESSETTQPKNYNRTEILKIGISGFCFANVMMLALPEYFSSGLIYESVIKRVIPMLQIALSLPVIFYTAFEFFIPSYQNLKKGRLIIDLPVSIAIIITFVRSIYEISMGLSNGYLDSMTGIVFFMLLGRWMQNRTHTFLQFNRKYQSYFPIAVEKIIGANRSMTSIQDIHEHDVIKIYNNEIIPVDSILSKGDAMIDYSFVNGESIPFKVNYGEHIYAGGKQVNGAIELVVMKRHSQSQLTTLWNHQAFKNNKAEVKSNWIDNIGLYFTIAVMGLSIVAGTYWFSMNQAHLAWNAITTVLIVACPCALLLTSSFTYGHFTRILSQHNFYVRDANVLDKISKINHIVFDKTGTLTYSDRKQVSYEGKKLDEKTKLELGQILYHSSHPLSKAIFNSLNVKIDENEAKTKEILGEGIEAWMNEKYYKIGSDKFCNIPSKNTKTKVNLLIDNQHIGTFYIVNAYRYGLAAMFKSIQEKFPISILSGDNDAEYQNLQKIVNKSNEVHFLQTPHQKLEYIHHLQHVEHKKVMMIGDGLNDAGAFQVSDVAIALTEKNNFFNPSSDVIMSSENIANLDKIMTFIPKAKTITYITFVYSILYNLIGLYFALRGELSPVIAAILMPISSISIILFVNFMSEIYHSKYLKH